MPSDQAHGFDDATGSPVLPASNWLAQVDPREAIRAAIHPLQTPRPRTNEDVLWTIPDVRGRAGWRIFAAYNKVFCADCGRHFQRIRKPIPDNLISWQVVDKTHRVYRGWQHSDGRLTCGNCWIRMSHFPPHILKQRAELALEAA